MPRIIVNPGSPSAWEIQLKSGTNRLGRAAGNDFAIADSSVSGSHCEILVDASTAVLKDLGSTNGSFVNRTRVKEATLQAGQAIHLGNVELLFCADVTAGAIAFGPPPHSAPPIRVATPVEPTPVPSMPAANHHCKFHPKTAARFLCDPCQQAFCDLCVNTRQTPGGPAKFCRHCGTQCRPLQVQVQAPHAIEGPRFFSSLPGAFAYPFRGSGPFVLIFGSILFAALNWFAGGIFTYGIPRTFSFGILMFVAAYGYLFTYLQSILHTTAVGDQEMPTLPGMSDFWQDILLPCLQLLGLCLLCFGPALVLALMRVSSEESSISGSAILIAFGLGCLYFPMAFLAVAMLDSIFAANPLQVLPSIAKVPVEYLTTLVLLAVVLGIRWLGDFSVELLFPRGLGTHNIAKLLGFIGVKALWGVGSLYLLTVNARLLGLLYVTRKEKLGWLTH